MLRGAPSNNCMQRTALRSAADAGRYFVNPKKDLSTMHKLTAGIKAGTVWGNCHMVVDPALPFGGYKQSGIGREQGHQGVESYMETKSVIIAL